MADTALFIGWGVPVRGREAKSLGVLNESTQYWSGLQQQGKIDSFEVALLDPHGGDLVGFAVLRGSPQQLAELRQSPEFQRLLTRAQLVAEKVGVVGAYFGQALAEQMSTYQGQLADLT